VPADSAAPAFCPSWWLRNADFQSVLPSLSLRRPAVRRYCQALIQASRAVLLESGDGVRLLGFAAEHAQPQLPQLAIILHGWEGSSDSLYVLALGQYLFERGFDVFRLNLRDHGDSHHLNRGLFHSCLLPEVHGAICQLAQRYPQHRRSLVGFSLGGNFALRVGVALAGVPALARIVAVSPVLDPQQTLLALEQGNPLYRRYFIDKWRRSLRKKQQAWPAEYDFSHLSQLTNLAVMTERLVLAHTQFSTLADYLRGYAITGEVLGDLRVPSRIILAQDDPIIPARDLARLQANPALSILLTQHGGHCGFRESLWASSWLNRFIHRELCQVG
jgi:uncharacterized protein